MTRREAILSGAQAAARSHHDLGTEKQLASTRGPVDVFAAILRSDAALLFRPLDGLLGACLPGPTPGVLISTKRPLPIQRFTGAHELGHVELHHTASLDGAEIIEQGDSLDDTNEIQANSFASEFLIPRWLLMIHGKAQGWNRESLKDPAVVYQMSLRVGASYEATCLALHTYGWIDQNVLAGLRAMPRKKIKQALVPGYEPEHWYRDIWVLTERDEGAVLLGQPDDLFVFRLDEKSGAGYLWDIDQLKSKNFLIVRDTRDLGDNMVIGGSVQRVIAAQSGQASNGDLSLAQRRPWQPSATPAGELHFQYDLRGKEEGLPRATRRRLQDAI